MSGGLLEKTITDVRAIIQKVEKYQRDPDQEKMNYRGRLDAGGDIDALYYTIPTDEKLQDYLVNELMDKLEED